MTSVRVPWIAGLVVFLAIALGAGMFLGRPESRPPVPRSALNARSETTAVASQTIARSLNSGLDSLAEVGTVVGESMNQQHRARLARFRHRIWVSLYLLDRGTRTVVDQIGGPAQPALLGDQLPADRGLRRAQVGSAQQIIEYVPVGGQFLLVGHVNAARYHDLLAVAGPAGAWLVDDSGTVIAGSVVDPPPPGLVDRATGAESSAGSQALGDDRSRQIVAWAPLTGGAPAASTKWTVVSTAAAKPESAPADNGTRTEMVWLATALGAWTLLGFGLLYLALIRPIRRFGRGSPVGWGEAVQVDAAFAHLKNPVGGVDQ